MTTIGTVLVALGFALGIYAYFLYPALLRIIAIARPRPVRTGEPAQWPMVSITVPAYNEERSIAATIQALLDIDYPADRRQILVVSDASSDRTDEIVRGFADRGVELLRQPARAGKTAAENAARALLRGDIIVNTDASVRVAKDALKPLIRCFMDPEVGVASGRDVSVANMEHDLNLGESQYVGYEMWLRDLETSVGSIVGASGCFYAVRRNLHMTIVPEALSRDFAAALIAREHDFRAVSVHDAVCYVPRIASLRHEFRRKVRTMTRGLETLYFKRHLLNPFRYGLFAWMLGSHKLIRWLVPWGIVAIAVGSIMLALSISSTWGWIAVSLFALFAVLASLGWWWPESRRAPSFVSIPAFVASAVIAAISSWVGAIRGDLNPIWEPTRRKPL